MNSVDTLVNISLEKNIEVEILDIAERLDFEDVKILRKFYATGKDYPFDTQPWCFPVLFKEMREAHKLEIGVEGFRKRLETLKRSGLLEKIHSSNPTIYTPITGKERVVRAAIMKFFIIHGITKFL